VRESAETNNVMVLVKLAAILVFVIGAARAVDTGNWRPFMPNGFPGVMTGAAIVSSLTSDSTPSRPPPRSAATRNAICLSASSPR